MVSMSTSRDLSPLSTVLFSQSAVLVVFRAAVALVSRWQPRCFAPTTTSHAMCVTHLLHRAFRAGQYVVREFGYCGQGVLC